MGALSKLYRGDQHVDFIGRRRIGYAVSAFLILLGMASVAVQGLDFSIEFRGGVQWEVPAGDAEVGDVRSALRPVGLGDAGIQRVSPPFGSEAGDTFRITAGTEATDIEREVVDALAEATGTDSSEININEVGPTWGEQISRSALRALIFFFLAIAAYMSWRFEWKMAAGALAAVVHDIVVTVGIYSLFNLDISPATAIAFLTILGYSLYDTIVVFDKVGEDVGKLASTGRMSSYGQAVNRALNEVLMRSVNTTITSVLPLISLIFIGSALGAETLQDFALVLLIGLAVGAYSSIFVAAPVLVALKEREPRFAAMKQRSGDRAIGPDPARGRAPEPVGTPAGAAGGGEVHGGDRAAPAAGATSARPDAARTAGGGVAPRGRKKGKRR